MLRLAVRILSLLVIGLGTIVSGSDTIAEQNSPPSITLKHSVPKILPPAGSIMTLEVEINNPSEALRPLRLYAVRDGRPYEQTVQEATYNSKEKPIYTFKLTAPIGEMRYQFFLASSPSPSESKPAALTSAIESQPYVISRPCISTSVYHNITLVDDISEMIVEDSRDVKTLIPRSRAIEEESLALTQAREALEAITKLTTTSSSKEDNNE